MRYFIPERDEDGGGPGSGVSVLSCCVVVVEPIPFLYKKGSGIMILGPSASPWKRNFVPDLYPRRMQALSATKNNFPQIKHKKKHLKNY